MNLELIKLQNLKIAEEKGFGITLGSISVPEKFALIHSEISEAYDGYIKGNFKERHGFEEELADVLLRTLHLAGALKIDFSNRPEKNIQLLPAIEGKLIVLHKIVSEAYEAYRKKDLDLCKEKILEVVDMVLAISADENINLEKVVLTKMELNKNRVWDKKLLNEELNKNL